MALTLETADRVDFEAIGTRWSIGSAAPVAPATRARIQARIAAYDATWSRFRADSAVSRLAVDGGPEDLGAEATTLLPLLETLRHETGGAMDPLVAASLAHLGYGGAARPGTRPAPAARVELRGTEVRVEPPALLDVGSAGKGQLVDLVAAVLAEDGHTDFVVDASGDLRVVGAPLTVALEHPYDATAAIGVVEVRDGAIAGSAVNRRSWTDDGGRVLHHVLDARTGRPVERIAATWAVAADAMTADALATALFLVDPAVLERRFAFGWVRMCTDGRVATSSDLRGTVFT